MLQGGSNGSGNIVTIFRSQLGSVDQDEWNRTIWPLQRTAETFVREIGRLCIKTPQSWIRAGDNTIIEAYDDPMCVNELKDVSQLWQQNRSQNTVAVHLGSREHAPFLPLLQEHFFAKPENELKVVGNTDHCSCLVLSGNKADEAKRLLLHSNLMN